MSTSTNLIKTKSETLLGASTTVTATAAITIKNEANFSKLTSKTSATSSIVHINSYDNITFNDIINNEITGTDTHGSNISSSGNSFKKISGDFIAVNCVNMTCKCAKTKYGLSPSCHTSNGCADLILVHKTSRWNYLRYLIRLTRNHSFVSIDDVFKVIYNF